MTAPARAVISWAPNCVTVPGAMPVRNPRPTSASRMPPIFTNPSRSCKTKAAMTAENAVQVLPISVAFPAPSGPTVV